MKIKYLVIVILVAFTQTVVANSWTFKEANKEVLVEKCTTWFKALDEENMDVLKSFYPTYLVKKHPQAFTQMIEEKMKLNKKHKSEPDYSEEVVNVKIGEKTSHVEILGKARQGKWTINTGCDFIKQKDGSWAYGNKVW